jgi:hypothetical protein
MANPATTANIESRWRPLTPAEGIVATTRLEDAWRKLKKDIPDLESRMSGNADLEADTVRVLADAVIRVLQSAARDGLRKGSVGVDDGTASWELDASIQAGLYFTDDELADLSSTGRRRRARAYSVQPS